MLERRSAITHRASVLADDLAGKRKMHRHGNQPVSARKGRLQMNFLR